MEKCEERTELLHRRTARVLQHMKHKGLTQLLVADPLSISYLTGVSIDPGERLFVLLLRAEEIGRAHV